MSLDSQVKMSIDSSKKALEIAKERENKELETDAYLGLGKAYRLKNKIETAIECDEKALEIAKARGNKERETDAYLGLAYTYRLINQIQNAIECEEKALEIAKERGNKERETDAYLGLAKSYRSLNNKIQTAIECDEKALEIAKARGNKQRETEAYLGLGYTFWLDNQIQTSIEHHEKALQIAKEQENLKERETEAYLGLGNAYRLNNQVQTAIEYFKKALEIAEEQGNKELETKVYLALGTAYRLDNQMQMAIDFFEKSLEIGNELGNTKQEIYAYLGLGYAYILSNRVQTAIHFCKKALEIAEKVGDNEEIINVYITVGDIYAFSKKHRTTMAEFFKKALNLAEKDGLEKLIIKAQSKLKKFDKYIYPNISEMDVNYVPLSTTSEQLLISGRSHQNEGRMEEAIKCYEQASNTADLKDIKARACQHLGNIYVQTSKYGKAIEFYQKAHEMSLNLEINEMEIVAYQCLGYNHLEAGQYQSSTRYYEEASKLASQFGYKKREINAYLGLGSACSNTGDFESSKSYFLKALTEAEQLQFENLQREAHTNLGHVYYKIGKFDAAVTSYLKAQELSHYLGDRKEEAHSCLMLGITFQQLEQHEKASESYHKALSISKELGDKEMATRAVGGLGSILFNIGQYEEALKFFSILVDLTNDLNGHETEQAFAQKSLGMCYAYLDRFEESLTYFKRSLEIICGSSDIATKGILNEWCGFCCRFIAGRHEEAIRFYEKAKDIAIQVGKRFQAYQSIQAIGNIFSNTCDYEKAKEYFQEAIKIAKELGDKFYEGTSCLTLASVSHKNNDYEMSIKWYEEALYIFRNLSNYLLQQNALTGLGIVCFDLEDTQQAIVFLREAQRMNKTAQLQNDLDFNQVHIKSSPKKKDSSSQVRDLNEEKNLENVVDYQEAEGVTVEWADSLIEEACNPERTEMLPSEDLARLEKYIKESSVSYVYTHRISSKKPFTEKVRKAMTENVKTSAYVNLLGQNYDTKRSGNDGKFVKEDKKIFNFARNEAFKNAATQKPAILNKPLASNMRSIGQIACGTVKATCFLVTNNLVLTNYHVYRMFQKERTEQKNSDLPITVSFDYFYPDQTEDLVTSEVDESEDTKLENPYLDYKFFRLKQNERLRNRDPLGPTIRNRQLTGGLVVILGHPGGKEMREEVCIIVSTSVWLERIRTTHGQCSGVHMTNAQLLEKTEDYQGCLPYDTSFFHGSSGSPVFDLAGHIVAMHAQGYCLEREEENIANVLNQGQGIDPSPEHKSVSKKYSLIEFGVQFVSICRDMRQRHGEDVVKTMFPNYKLEPGVLPMDQT